MCIELTTTANIYPVESGLQMIVLSPSGIVPIKSSWQILLLLSTLKEWSAAYQTPPRILYFGVTYSCVNIRILSYSLFVSVSASYYFGIILGL